LTLGQNKVSTNNEVEDLKEIKQVDTSLLSNSPKPSSKSSKSGKSIQSSKSSTEIYKPKNSFDKSTTELDSQLEQIVTQKLTKIMNDSDKPSLSKNHARIDTKVNIVPPSAVETKLPNITKAKRPALEKK